MKLRYLTLLAMSLLVTQLSAEEMASGQQEPSSSMAEAPSMASSKAEESTDTAKKVEDTSAKDSMSATGDSMAASKDSMSATETGMAATDNAIKKEINSVDKLSYSFGRSVGISLKQQDTQINFDVLLQGIKDSLYGTDKPLLTEQEVSQVLISFRQEKMAKEAEVQKKLAGENTKKGEAFLAENSKKEGIITLPSGLQYKVLKEGTGKTPKPTDVVTTHYRGTLIDGTEFDSSYSRGEPASFPVNGVIAGWTEALQLMKEGGKLQLFVPAKLAYGERQMGDKITPNSTLIFEVELISIGSGAK
jgi:FKBP-type peptidyl-prolyl cis-trans isomerase